VQPATNSKAHQSFGIERRSICRELRIASIISRNFMRVVGRREQRSPRSPICGRQNLHRGNPVVLPSGCCYACHSLVESARGFIGQVWTRDVLATDRRGQCRYFSRRDAGRNWFCRWSPPRRLLSVAFTGCAISPGLATAVSMLRLGPRPGAR
jgi:hypothetical protein